MAAISRQAPSGSELLGMGVFLAGAVLVPIVLGLLADGALHTSPAFLLVGIVLGIVLAGLGVYSRFKRYL